jgi:hypothetical protein
MNPITALVMQALDKDSIEAARPLLVKRLTRTHRPPKAKRLADALLATANIPPDIQKELPEMLGLAADSVNTAISETRALIAKKMHDELRSETFKRYGPHINIGLGRPHGPLFIAWIFSDKRIRKLPENIHGLLEAKQYALVKQAIETMLQEHGESFKNSFTSLNGFDYCPTEDVCIRFDMNGNPEESLGDFVPVSWALC